MLISKKEWLQKAENLQRRRVENPITPNLSLYKKIVSLVSVGETVLDVGCGQCHLVLCLPKGIQYTGIDPFPLDEKVNKMTAEELISDEHHFDTVFMLAALDNVQNVPVALRGLKTAARKNIVILTGIGIEPDEFHTHKIERKDLVKELGEPYLEKEVLPRVFLFEFKSY